MYFTCASTASCNSSGRSDEAPPRPGPETRAILVICCVDMFVVDFTLCKSYACRAILWKARYDEAAASPPFRQQ